MKNVYFVSGIDTDIGKSYATGFLAREWMNEGKSVITQKLVQTGNVDVSEDILLHREMMGIAFTEEDDARITMPQIFTYPCSPHLAAEIDGRELDFEAIDRATVLLSERYDRVLLEGAGGLMVPLTRELLTIDFVAERGYEIILTTSGRLGSLNHTLLSLEAIERRGIKLHSVVYNLYPKVEDTTILRDSQQYIKDYLSRKHPSAEFICLDVY